MNRNFPPETIRPCDLCGRDLTLVELVDGGYEANDQRDYVDADPRLPEDEWVIVCGGCKTATGIGEPDE